MTWEPLTPETFRRLPEYSCSVPTGQTIGKRWRCNQNSGTRYDAIPGAPADWWIQWYAKHPEEPDKLISIRSRKALSFEIPKDLK